MAVTEVLRALGGWSLQVRSEIPQDIWDALGYFGHIVIHSGPVDSRVGGDALLDSARFVGVLRDKSNTAAEFSIGGPGMAMWLGDEDGKGAVIESLLSIEDKTFEQAVRLILPPASSHILEGTYFNLPGPPPNYTGTFQWVSQREALNYLADVMGADWKVLGTGRLNAGPASSLFVTTPVTAVVRRDSGVDMAMRGFRGNLRTQQDLADFTTRTVVMMDDGSGGTTTADADIAPGLNPFLDIHGATLRMTRLIAESSTDPTNAEARAQLQLNRFSGATNAIELSTSEYDVKGDAAVGDSIWVFDPEIDVFDEANEVIFRGVRMYPMKLRLVETTWPVVRGMGVSYRDKNGLWFDLSDYITWETGDTELVVGDFNRDLNDGSDTGGGLPAPPPVPNLTVPDAPDWVEPFNQGTYQSALNGNTKAQTELRWTQPANTDGSVLSDGAYYEIRYRSATTPLFPVTHAQMAVYTHAQLNANGGTFGQPIHYATGDWQYTRVPIDELTTILYELTPSMPYEAQVRAVDNAPVANAGIWSVLADWQTTQDTLPPAVPAAPEVAASLISVQITHRLGRASGGTFNLDKDLHHLEIHGEYEPGFMPSEATRLGRLLANQNMMAAQAPVVGSFNIPDVAPVYFKVVAVDEAGNKSLPSPVAVATALLIDDAHISTLTVSKVIAGTMTASWIMAGEFVTGPAGPRAGFNAGGFFAQDASSNTTFDVDSGTGDVFMVGNFASGLVGERVEVNPVSTNVPEIWFSTGSSGRHAYINALDPGGEYISLGLNSGPSTINANVQSTILLRPDDMHIRRCLTGSLSRRGGYIEILENDIRVGAIDDGSFDTFIRMEKIGGSHYYTGRYAKTQTDGGKSALYVDQIGGSGTNASVSYGATMVSTPQPIVDMQPTSGGVAGKYHCISSRSATGFGVEYPAGNCDIFVWAFRTD